MQLITNKANMDNVIKLIGKVNIKALEDEVGDIIDALSVETSDGVITEVIAHPRLYRDRCIYENSDSAAIILKKKLSTFRCFIDKHITELEDLTQDKDTHTIVETYRCSTCKHTIKLTYAITNIAIEADKPLSTTTEELNPDDLFNHHLHTREQFVKHFLYKVELGNNNFYADDSGNIYMSHVADAYPIGGFYLGADDYDAADDFLAEFYDQHLANL